MGESITPVMTTQMGAAAFQPAPSRVQARVHVLAGSRTALPAVCVGSPAALCARLPIRQLSGIRERPPPSPPPLLPLRSGRAPNPPTTHPSIPPPPPPPPRARPRPPHRGFDRDSAARVGPSRPAAWGPARGNLWRIPIPLTPQARNRAVMARYEIPWQLCQSRKGDEMTRAGCGARPIVAPGRVVERQPKEHHDSQ